jgi:DNA-binding NarL/FixJ family response regulator
MNNKVRIHLADDHQVLMDGMKAFIETNSNYEITGYSVNGLNLLDNAVKQNATIVIMDINMPEKDGIEVMKDYALQEYPFKIIILSIYNELKLIKEMMKLGAKSYLTKQCAAENIMEAIEAVNNGEDYFCETIRTKIFDTFAKKNSYENISVDHLVDSNISKREFDILKLIALEYTTEEISEELYITINTVGTHRKNLIKKLNVKSSIGLVKYAIKNNIINN